SDRFHTSAAPATISAPAPAYSASAIPAPSPAPISTSTSTPRCTNSVTPSGVMATRYSLFLISVGTPTVLLMPPDHRGHRVTDQGLSVTGSVALRCHRNHVGPGLTTS